MVSKKVLVDTNIFLDYYLNRKSGYLPIGEFAAQFIQRTLKCKYVLLVCNELIEEMSKNLKISEESVWDKVLLDLNNKGKIQFISRTHSQSVEAFKISKLKHVPFYDALFAVMARDMGTIVITRDKHFIEDLYAICKAMAPEELD